MQRNRKMKGEGCVTGANRPLSTWAGRSSAHSRWGKLVLLLVGLFSGLRAMAVGSWTTLANTPPNGGAVQMMLLLSDGTVMAQQAPLSSNSGSANWYRLTPDIHGSYINGTWSTVAPMNYTHEYYSSAVLRDGRVFVAGGEYGTGGSANVAEIYDPKLDTWTVLPVPAGTGFSDSCCVILPNGNLLIAPVNSDSSRGTLIYDPTSNTFSTGPSALGSQSEACWVKLPDDSILTIDSTTDPNLLNSSERFIPSLNNGQGGWSADDSLKVPMYNSTREIGAGVLLPDGRAWFFGGNHYTAYYTPSGNTNQGVWAAGPEMPAPGAGWDEPAAVLVNGKVLYQTFIYPTADPGNPQARGYFELDPTPTPTNPLGTITEVLPEWGDNSGYSHMMLNLPDGKLLVAYG
ncbi:MAG: Kelch repeat-containing protein, partial [Limisphaerales bacterium]